MSPVPRRSNSYTTLEGLSNGRLSRGVPVLEHVMESIAGWTGPGSDIDRSFREFLAASKFEGVGVEASLRSPPFSAVEVKNSG